MTRMPVIPLPPRPQARNGTLAAAITLALGAAQAYAADPGDNLQEIVVTANRREQNLIDVPYNISAVSGVPRFRESNTRGLRWGIPL